MPDTPPPINLTQLRAKAELAGYHKICIRGRKLLALIDTAEAARETANVFWRMNERTRGIAPTPDLGPEWGQMQTATAALQQTLDRFHKNP